MTLSSVSLFLGRLPSCRVVRACVVKEIHVEVAMPSSQPLGIDGESPDEPQAAVDVRKILTTGSVA
jgi:hypothetical protein